MAERRSFVIIGSGIAGITAAETLRAEDASAAITLIADNPLPVYTRPALKDYLAGRADEATLYARRKSFYAERAIHFVLDRAVEIAVESHSVNLRSGRQVSYDCLLLATGAKARRLTCPGAELAGVVALRTLADYQAALQLLPAARRAVVVGSGPVALETVEALTLRGLQVTHLLRGQRLWSSVLDATASELLLQQERRGNVDVRTGDEVAEIAGSQGRVVGIITKSGARIPCDLLVAAIGSEPVVDYISVSGIACGRGARIDHTMRTGAPDVFAAGDVAEVTDTITGQSRITGQWYPAIQQGRAAAYSMLGLPGTRQLLHASAHSSAFLHAITSTRLFGLDIAAIGASALDSNAPGCQAVLSDPAICGYARALLKNGVPIGALSFDGRVDMLSFKRAVDHAVDLSPVAAHLFAREFKLATWLDAQKVPTPVLAVRKARPGEHSQLSQLSTLAPERGTRNQFMLPASSQEDESVEPIESMDTLRLRPATNPYTLPVVAVNRLKEQTAGIVRLSETTGKHTQQAGSPREDGVVAFLVPVLPLETARAVHRAMPGSALEQLAGHFPADGKASTAPGAAVTLTAAPEWSHTRLIQGEVVTIGRESTSTLGLNHNTVSRRHAEITCVDGRYYLRDLDSRNGTFVNNARLEPRRAYPLQPRDQLRIGTFITYVFDVRSS